MSVRDDPSRPEHLRPEQLRSARWFAPDDLRSFGHRSRAMQLGYGPADWAGKPVIAIVNTWSDINPCHMHFKQRVDDVKRGVLQAGGFPLELPAICLSEPFVKPTTMLLRSHPVDGAVLMGGCDKTTPGLLMGAFSAGLPCIYLPAGPMLRGNWKGKGLGSGSDGFKFWDERRAGKLSQAEWLEVEGGIARSHGTCMTMGTAATMMGIAEALGMTLPGASSIPAPDANHVRMSSECGRRAVQMVWDDLTPAKLLTRASFDNAIAVAMAMGCSTNAIIHLVAMSRRAGAHCAVTLDDFDAASRHVPVIANIRPSGDTYLMEDFYYAGGLPAMMNRMAGKLALDAMTVNGRTVGQNIDGAQVYDDDVIRTMDNPLYAEGALAVPAGRPDSAHVHQPGHRAAACACRQAARAGGDEPAAQPAVPGRADHRRERLPGLPGAVVVGPLGHQGNAAARRRQARGDAAQDHDLARDSAAARDARLRGAGAGGEGIYRFRQERARPVDPRDPHRGHQAGVSRMRPRVIAANPLAAGLPPGAASTDRIEWIRLSLVFLPLATPISDAKVLTGRQKPLTEIAFVFAELQTRAGHAGTGFSYSKRAGGRGQYEHAKETWSGSRSRSTPTTPRAMPRWRRCSIRRSRAARC